MCNDPQASKQCWLHTKNSKPCLGRSWPHSSLTILSFALQICKSSRLQRGLRRNESSRGLRSERPNLVNSMQNEWGINVYSGGSQTSSQKESLWQTKGCKWNHSQRDKVGQRVAVKGFSQCTGSTDCLPNEKPHWPFSTLLLVILLNIASHRQGKRWPSLRPHNFPFLTQELTP